MTRTAAGEPSSGAELAELARLYFEHMNTEIHTGMNYVEGCPSCDATIPFTDELLQLIVNQSKEVG